MCPLSKAWLEFRPFAHVVLPIVTPRLVLRPFAPEDLADYARYHADPEIARWLEVRVQRLKGKALLARIERERTHTVAGRRLVLATTDARDETFRGRLEVWAPDYLAPPEWHDVASMRVGILAAHRRQGIARAAASAVLEAIAVPRRPLELQIDVPASHAPALALARALGAPVLPLWTSDSSGAGHFRWTYRAPAAAGR